VAPAALENYELDVHIDNGLLGTSFDRLLQDLIVKPGWMAILWLTHVAVVALEWCFSLDLLGGGTLGSVTGALHTMRDALTRPWLVPVLALAGIAVVYNGVVRRRVVETLGQFALMLAMMIGGLAVIADPEGTVGAGSRLANEASLGALGAAAAGDPAHPIRGLDDALREVFDAAITRPWCYLEFGDVAWCREPSRLDSDLVATARDIVSHDRAQATGRRARSQVEVEAREIARARTNAELFLALPANGPRRNSINADPGDPSLLRVLCGGGDDTSCPAATGPQAEFRTQKGTAARIGGLLLIGIGSVGMFALLGFVCLRLLGATLLALLHLLIAPVAVLAPALGDSGRELFRRWSMRLLGAVLAKLVYAVFLGVILLMVRVLGGLGGLGWWTQWLLLTAFWWLVFTHRHRVLETVIHERAEPTRRASLAHRLFATRQALKLAGPPARVLGGAVRRTVDQLRHLTPRASVIAGRPGRRKETATRDDQVARTLERDHAAAVATVARAPTIELDLEQLRTDRERLGRERRSAVADGDRRRAASLPRREHDAQARIDAGERELAAARVAAPAGEELRRRTGVVHDEAQRTLRAELLDREMELRPRLAPAGDPRRGRRDYAQLASLLGLDGGEFARLGDPARRRAQLEIDRQLEARRAATRSLARAQERSDWLKRVDEARRRDRRQDPRPPSRRERQFGGRAARDDSRPRSEPASSGTDARPRRDPAAPHRDHRDHRGHPGDRRRR
ncbi:MAG: hypothetical protein QOD61_1564, partial [Solirubrobacteraceae bacterium]|nr:hypothetical protein [Solirubrobacteraceae bacterium]